MSTKLCKECGQPILEVVCDKCGKKILEYKAFNAGWAKSIKNKNEWHCPECRDITSKTGIYGNIKVTKKGL